MTNVEENNDREKNNKKIDNNRVDKEESDNDVDNNKVDKEELDNDIGNNKADKKKSNNDTDNYDNNEKNIGIEKFNVRMDNLSQKKCNNSTSETSVDNSQFNRLS